MTKYAKFIDEKTIEEAPAIKDGVFFCYNSESNETMLRADGYKPVIFEVCPSDMVQPSIRYREQSDRIEAYYIDTYVAPPIYEPGYQEKRAAEYPPYQDYLDAQVKINSGDDAMIVAGQEQLAAYYEACLAVKLKYPKPSNITGGENA